MRSHAKASSAGSSMRRGKGLGRIFRGEAVTRGVSGDSDGSGAPSYRGRLALLGLSAFALTGLILLVTSAFASKQVVDYFGSSGNKGGQFSGARDVAVNSSGAGGVPAGTTYVIDESNNRLQRFSPSGEFVSAWGANVQTPPVNEVQTLNVQASGGTYTLSFDGATTAPLAYNASSSAVGTALSGLPTVGGSGVFVEGSGSFTIYFFNKFGATNVPQIFVDDTNLSGTASTGHPTQGFGAYEVCTVAANCRAGSEISTANFNDNAKNGALSSPQSVAVDGDSGNVYVSDRRNNRVNEYTGEGTFIRSFGFGVDATTAGSGYEVCPAADRCTVGLGGSGAGQIGAGGEFSSRRLGIAVSPADGSASSGSVFLADTVNRRVNTYDLDGTNPSSFGSEAQFGENQPRKVAVDSRGIVYASNSNGGGEIERYDTEDANGGGVGFLAPIAAPPLLSGFAASATAGLAVDPDSDGGGADEDVLYVLRDPSSGNTVVQQYGPTNDPGLTAAPTAVDDTHGAEAGFEEVGGLGLNNASGKLYVSATGNISGIGFGERVYVLDNISAPAATLDPITSFDAHSATFSGEVNPNGNQTQYRFEYVDDANFQATGFTNAAKFPLADVSLGSGTSSIDVEDEVPHHLVPATTYHVRLVAKQTFTATQTIGGPLTFTTPGASPSLEADATDVETDSAVLRGAINPEGQAVTNYHFEWGTTAAYGNSTPAGTLPSGAAPVAVEEELPGLTTGQTYHYRLLATNSTGTTTGPDQTFTPAAPPEPPQRAYELVSHYPTGGTPVFSVNGQQMISEDGNRVGATSTLQLPFATRPPLPDEPPGNGEGGGGQYIFSRGADGWSPFQTGLGSLSWSANIERLLLETVSQVKGSGYAFEDPLSRVDPDDQNKDEDVYQWNAENDKLTWISRDPRIPVGTPQTALGHAETIFPSAFSMSTDGRTVVFKSTRQLLDSDTTPNKGAETASRLYKWEDGQLSFIGVRPDGTVPPQGSRLGAEGAEEGSPRHAVSSDGSRVVFSARRGDEGGDPYSLYVQTDGQPTVEASKAEGVPALPSNQPYDVSFRDAATDGKRVFFTSASRLTPDSGAGASNGGALDLYAYDVEADELRDLTPRLDGLEDVSVDPASADRARVRGVAAISEDGKRVYFVADAQYPTAPNPEGDLPSASGRNLYVADLDGIEDPIGLRFIASLGSEDISDWMARWDGSSIPEFVGKSALASGDGSVLGFASKQSLTGQPLGGTAQLFAYNAERGALECPSCPSDGSLPADTVNRYFLGFGESHVDWQQSRGVRHWVSEDGTVFFNTKTALLPGDENIVNDVYEFHDGALGLVSTGKSTRDTTFSNATPDGTTVLFQTLDSLVPQDKEPGIPKTYAARVGGGFPYVAPPPPCDFNAGACEGAPSSVPQTPGAGTAAFEGPGNPKPSSAQRCPKGKRKVRAKGKTRCVKRQQSKRHAKNDRRASR